MNKLEQLRKNGFKITVKHYRYDREYNAQIKRLKELGVKNVAKVLDLFDVNWLPIDQKAFGPKEIGAKGGTTVIELLKDGRQGCGVAYCSTEDNFNRSIGVAIALSKAIKNFESSVPF